MTRLQVGALMGDPKADKGDVGRAFDRVATALRRRDIPGPGVELVYHFPGPLSTPDHEGLKLTKRKGGQVQAWIAVPPSIATSQDREQVLLQLAGDALLAASRRQDSEAVKGDRTEIDRLVREISEELGISTPLPGRDDRAILFNPGATTGCVELVWELPADASRAHVLERLFAFEDLVGAELKSTGLGDVDGNEVSDATFAMYVDCGPDDQLEVIKRIRALARTHQLEAYSLVSSAE